jgi:AraC-like DNA-binding protein
MIGCSTATVTDPDDYRENVPGASINLVLTDLGDFKARLTWVNLRRLGLVRGEENTPRVAFVALAPGPVFISFPTCHDPPPIWSGVEMRPGEMVLHSRGERIHQRTSGAGQWGLISLEPKVLIDYGWVLARKELTAPPAAKFPRPPPKVVAELLRLHAQACRLANTKPDVITHREVARAIEQELLDALINCLIAEEVHRDAGTRQRHATIMARFEDVLASHCDKQMPMPELCAAVGAPERTLGVCCTQFLGMSPGQYARLRRLHLVRAALRRADPTTASVGAIARHYGFSELGRFAVVYRLSFGETPSTTLRDYGASAEFA